MIKNGLLHTHTHTHTQLSVVPVPVVPPGLWAWICINLLNGNRMIFLPKRHSIIGEIRHLQKIMTWKLNSKRKLHYFVITPSPAARTGSLCPSSLCLPETGSLSSPQGSPRAASSPCVHYGAPRCEQHANTAASPTVMRSAVKTTALCVFIAEHVPQLQSVGVPS